MITNFGLYFTCFIYTQDTMKCFDQWTLISLKVPDGNRSLSHFFVGQLKTKTIINYCQALSLSLYSPSLYIIIMVTIYLPCQYQGYEMYQAVRLDLITKSVSPVHFQILLNSFQRLRIFRLSRILFNKKHFGQKICS